MQPARHQAVVREACAELEGVEYFEAKDRGEAVLSRLLQLVWVSEARKEKEDEAPGAEPVKVVTSQVTPETFEDWRNQQWRNGLARSIELRIWRQNPYRMEADATVMREGVLEMVDAELLVMYNEREIEGAKEPNPRRGQ